MQPLRFDSPDIAIKFLTGFASLVVAIACYLDWCGALLPRRWRLGVGFGKAWRIMWRRILARPEWKWVLPMAVDRLRSASWHCGCAMASDGTH